MKIALITILLLLGIDLNDIAKINTLKEQAEDAYTKGDYQSAFESYKMLVDSFKVVDDNVLMNYANSAYSLTGLKGKIDNNNSDSDGSNYADAAMSSYQKLTNSKDKVLKSSAYNQIGVINYQLGDAVQKSDKYLNESLSYFKQSLKSDPGNDNARYNYEIVKKKLEENKDQQENQDQENQDEEKEDDQENKDQQNQDQQDQENQDQQNQDQENQDQQNQDQQNQDQENQEEEQKDKNGDQQEQEQEEQQQQEQEGQDGEQDEKEVPQSPSDKFKEMNISEDMAKMILEALRNNEVQYLQQQKRKPTKRADSSKPDW